MKRLSLWFTALLLASLFWGAFVESYWIEETRFDVAVANLPDAWEGKQVAVFADLQVGMWLGNSRAITKICSRIVDLKPAAVLIAGDFIYHPVDIEESVEETREEYESEDYREDAREEIVKMLALLAPLTASEIPVFAVLGNHDYGIASEEEVRLEWLADQLASALGSEGVTVLRNEAEPVSLPEARASQIYMVGIDSRYAHADRPLEAFRMVPEGEARIVFMHNPQSFFELPGGSATLAIAAHTHGGQIRIPFFPRRSWLNIVKDWEIDVDGWVARPSRKENGLYVNRGIGFSKIPIRINCRPELTLFTLRKAN